MVSCSHAQRSSRPCTTAESWCWASRPKLTGEEKSAALETITEHLLPGRWTEARHPNKKELAATLVLSLPLDEVSVKVSDGPPEDEPADVDIPIWAGVVPMRETFAAPIPAPDLKDAYPGSRLRQGLVALSQSCAATSSGTSTSVSSRTSSGHLLGNARSRSLPRRHHRRPPSRTAFGRPLEQLVFIGAPSEQQHAVVEGLREVDIDVAPVARFAMNRRPARPFSHHQCALLGVAEPACRCHDPCTPRSIEGTTSPRRANRHA